VVAKGGFGRAMHSYVCGAKELLPSGSNSFAPQTYEDAVLICKFFEIEIIILTLNSLGWGVRGLFTKQGFAYVQLQGILTLFGSLEIEQHLNQFFMS
jgi:hypothetical protein